MDATEWPQEIVVKPMEDMLTNNATTNSSTKPTSTSLERRVRPQRDQALNCPRCNSTNTKFCYYNNYSLSQPRYFCKTCRRYWTQGGTLRNIPVGGGSTKKKKRTSSAPTPSSASSGGCSSKLKHLADLKPSPNSSSQPSHHGQDLNLGFPTNPEFRGLCEFIHLPTMEYLPKLSQMPTNPTTSDGAFINSISALELLNGLTSSSGLVGSFMQMTIPDKNLLFSSGFGMQGDFKPTLGFNLDGIGSVYGNTDLQGAQETGNGNVLFPLFENLKQISGLPTDQDNEQCREQQAGDSDGHWSGMLGRAGSW